MRKDLLVFLAGASVATLAAQDIQQRANITRGGGSGGGSCTVDVIVDGAAEVQLRGDNASVHDLSGAAPHLRQFTCTQPMPPNAPGFRFTPIDGRGRQELVQIPKGGSPVMVRIEDPQNGAGEYRFEVGWGGGGDGYRPEQGDRGYNRSQDMDRDHAQYDADRSRFFQGNNWRSHLFERVREDIEHLQHSTFPFTGDQSRLSGTIQQLNELQSKSAQGQYDQHELRDVTDALSTLLQYNRLSARDRDMLSDDLNRLREYREGHERDHPDGRR